MGGCGSCAVWWNWTEMSLRVERNAIVSVERTGLWCRGDLKEKKKKKRRCDEHRGRRSCVGRQRQTTPPTSEQQQPCTSTPLQYQTPIKQRRTGTKTADGGVVDGGRLEQSVSRAGHKATLAAWEPKSPCFSANRKLQWAPVDSSGLLGRLQRHCAPRRLLTGLPAVTDSTEVR